MVKSCPYIESKLILEKLENINSILSEMKEDIKNINLKIGEHDKVLSKQELVNKALYFITGTVFTATLYLFVEFVIKK